MNSFNVKSRITKAVILAGGQGTRLAPLTNYCPLWMFPVLNKPLIEHTIDFLKRNGFDDIIITLSEDEKIPDFLNNFSDKAIKYYTENRPRGTAGTLKDIEGLLGNEPFLVINSNLLTGHMDLSSFIKFHFDSGSIATLGLYRDAKNGVEETVRVAEDRTVQGFHFIHPSVNSRSPWRSSGIYLFEPSVLEFIDKRNYMDIKEQLIPSLQKESLNVFAYEIEEFHSSINSMNDYINLHRILLLRNGHTDYLNGREEIKKGVWAGKNVVISPHAYLLGPVIIGNDCTIDSNAQIIGPAVIGNGCRISEGALIRESIVWNGVSLSNGSNVEYSVLGEGANVSDNSHIRSMIVLNGFKIADANLIPSDYGIRSTVNLSDNGAVSIARLKLYRIAKKMMDMTLSAIGILFLLPLFLLIAIAIKIDSAGPVFYIQKRCGKDGKLFKMIKFRTMVMDAGKQHKKLVSRKDVDGPMFKLRNDPRITRIGSILRKTSLDELPQLINVLKGEMSLVGPRPLIMDEMKLSPSWRNTRLKVKPGITGLWQIGGRSNTPFHEWIKQDTYYVKNQSLKLDIKVLLKTIKIVFNRIGSY